MQLTKHTDYGLRVLIYLALHPDQRIPVSTIAEAFRISRNHLHKVTQALTAAGFVRSHRGNRGGIDLAVAAEQIGIGKVVRALEPASEIVNCTRPLCPMLPACRLKPVLVTARAAFLNELDRWTLGDLLHNRRSALRALLPHTLEAEQL